jgi:hypothetical protein
MPRLLILLVFSPLLFLAQKEGIWTDTLATTVDLTHFKNNKKVVEVIYGRAIMFFNQSDYYNKELDKDTVKVTPKYFNDYAITKLLKSGLVVIKRRSDDSIVPSISHRMVQYGSMVQREFSFMAGEHFFSYLEVFGLYHPSYVMDSKDLKKTKAKKITPKKEFAYPEEYADTKKKERVFIKDYFPAAEGRRFAYHLPENYDETDTIKCKTAMLQKQKIFYFADDGFTKYPGSVNVSHNVFGEALFFYRHDSCFTMECDDEKDISEKQIKDALLIFPAYMNTGDNVIYKLQSERKVYTLLRREDISVGSTTYKDCLKFKLITHWPETIYIEYFWLKKNVGMVKWLRSTGRVDELVKYFPD